MSKLSDALTAGRFVVTTELNPPKGTDLTPLLDKAESLKDVVTAFNLTDSHTARMTMSPIAVAHLMLDMGLEPILQMTCRDKNRIALQADMLAASALGIANIVTMTGDPPGSGDHPSAKPVFDVDSTALLRALSSLQDGHDMMGSQVMGKPQFFAGAVVNPGAPVLDTEIRRMEEKIEAGAAFFQTQAVYEPDAFERFMKRVERFDVPILAGFIMLKSGNMARTFNGSVPGISIPESLIRELDGTEDRREKSAEIASRVIREIQPMCQGVHIMAIGWESLIPGVLEAAEIV